MLDFLSQKLSDLILTRIPSRTGAKGNGRFATATSIGLVRTANEDRCAIAKVRFGGAANRDFNLGIVCDGLGGMEAGQDAAVTAIAAFIASLLRSRHMSPAEQLQEGVREANNEIYASLRGRGGTTLSAVVVTRQHGSFLCHAGDSRLFAIGPQRSLHQLTRDDTLSSILGKPSNESARDNRLVQFVGIGEDLEPQVARVPEGATSFLLTSDGAHDVPANMLQRVVTNASSPLELARRLTQLSDILGGADNSSVVVLPSRLDDAGTYAPGVEISLIVPADEMTILFDRYVSLRTSIGDEPNDPAKLQPIPERKRQPSRRRTSGSRKKTTNKSDGATPRKRASTNEPKDGELPLEQKPSGTVDVEFEKGPKGKG